MPQKVSPCPCSCSTIDRILNSRDRVRAATAARVLAAA
ncbi:MAG: LacI family DNA-binding transcriptional regulator [Pseudorhodobacter sp.]|nr:LacI family DNA-binding transcriptional regulator [Pseudorhodobacter sp.]